MQTTRSSTAPPPFMTARASLLSRERRASGRNYCSVPAANTALSARAQNIDARKRSRRVIPIRCERPSTLCRYSLSTAKKVHHVSDTVTAASMKIGSSTPLSLGTRSVISLGLFRATAWILHLARPRPRFAKAWSDPPGARQSAQKDRPSQSLCAPRALADWAEADFGLGHRVRFLLLIALSTPGLTQRFRAQPYVTPGFRRKLFNSASDCSGRTPDCFACGRGWY